MPSWYDIKLLNTVLLFTVWGRLIVMIYNDVTKWISHICCRFNSHVISVKSHMFLVMYEELVKVVFSAVLVLQMWIIWDTNVTNSVWSWSSHYRDATETLKVMVFMKRYSLSTVIVDCTLHLYDTKMKDVLRINIIFLYCYYCFLAGFLCGHFKAASCNSPWIYEDIFIYLYYIYWYFCIVFCEYEVPFIDWHHHELCLDVMCLCVVVLT